MLSSVQSETHKRGHRHKRSAAISGDFDVAGSNIFGITSTTGPISPSSSFAMPHACTIDQSIHTKSFSLPKDSYMLSNPPPTLIVTDSELSQLHSSPKQLQFRLPEDQPGLKPNPTPSTPSPKKHTRLKSWAHSFIKPEKEENLEYQSSSNESTPENKKRQVTQESTSLKSNHTTNYTYNVPEAVIDLDLASGVFYNPDSSIPVKTSKFKEMHRRTESAPELEDFYKYRVFSNNSSSTQAKNSAIYEEDEENEDAISSTTASSTSNNNNNNAFSQLSENKSTNSVNSIQSLTNSSRHQSPSTLLSNVSSPKPSSNGGIRRGRASAARYQNYYQSSLLLSNAIKSNESLSQQPNLHSPSSSMNHKASMSSVAYKFQRPSSSSSNSSTNSYVLNSPSGFAFESKVYDIPTSASTSSINIDPTIETLPSPRTPIINKSQNKQPKKLSTPKTHHKKSKSLLSSLNSKIRRGSHSKEEAFSPSITTPVTTTTTASSTRTAKNKDSTENDDYEDADCTITPSNFGEPGPSLDLTTMKPKLHNNDEHFNDTINSDLYDNHNTNNTNKQTHRHTKKNTSIHIFRSWMKNRS